MGHIAVRCWSETHIKYLPLSITKDIQQNRLQTFFCISMGVYIYQVFEVMVLTVMILLRVENVQYGMHQNLTQ